MSVCLALKNWRWEGPSETYQHLLPSNWSGIGRLSRHSNRGMSSSVSSTSRGQPATGKPAASDLRRSRRKASRWKRIHKRLSSQSERRTTKLRFAWEDNQDMPTPLDPRSLAAGSCSLPDRSQPHLQLELRSSDRLQEDSIMAANRTNTKVIVVGGGGTIGSSTALHLVRNGYTPSNITVLDTFEIPSAQSAGNDLNKIMGVRLRNKVDLQMSLEALQMWKEDDLFKPFFHQTGRMDCEHTPEGVEGLSKQYQALRDAGVGLEKTHEWLDNEDAILSKMQLLSRDQIQGWKAIWSQDGGWLAAAKAINAIGVFLKERGVRFGFSSAGSFKQPIFGADGTTCIGVETVDGTKYYADKVVLAAGAWSPTLVDLEDQCCSKAWVYAHIQLTPEEAAQYKGVPVVYNGEVGFFFEPNEYGVIKVCDEFPGFSRFKQHQPFGAPSPKRISVPRSHAKHPTDTYPDASEVSIKKAIATFLPRFKEKELFNRALCWCTDTADAALLMCEHPRWKNFILATGDSGHSFKILPNVGKHVVELIEGRLPEDMARQWRWRPGGDALKSRRAAPPKDLADMPGWRHDPKL